MSDLFIYNQGKKLKCGYTTGSCAAAAAKAAAYMLHHQEPLNSVTIDTPKNISLTLDVQDPMFDDQQAVCGIIKDAGDDHDATNGMTISARVRRNSDAVIVIRGGEGVGTITRDGFWGKTGDPAINPVPRQMIMDAVSSVAGGGWIIEISAPEGRKIAKNTLNSKIGITGGISIIGTTGIVEPMSLEAMKQTIYLEIDAISKANHPEILLFLGNYGEKMAESMGLTAPSVKISNFIGDAVLYCHKQKFKKVTLIGHIGKLSKLSIGAFFTHSSACDLRIEGFIHYLALAGAPVDYLKRVSRAGDSEEALAMVRQEGYDEIIKQMSQGCRDRIRKYVKDPEFNIDIIFYSLQTGLLE